MSHLWSWTRGLLLRKPDTVPSDVLHAWIVLWLLAILIALLFLVAVFPNPTVEPWTWYGFSWLGSTKPVAWMMRHSYLHGFAGIALGIVLHKLLVPYFGDVARYARADPTNVEKRREVLERGLNLLRSIHNDSLGTHSYDRVVIVGHSLGSIIAYDLLTHFWVEFYKSYKLQDGSELRRIYEEMDELFDQGNEQSFIHDGFSQARFASLQEELQRELRIQKEKPWRITDFVTVGSPLTHAEFLITGDETALRDRQRLREMPTCPPTPERESERWTITYRPGEQAKWRLPNHATVFASVRWTNIYCRNWLAHIFLVPGDIISGPVAGHFGPGVRDRRVWIWSWKTLLFAHTAYWRWKDGFDPRNPPAHIRVLREAVNLADVADRNAPP